MPGFRIAALRSPEEQQLDPRRGYAAAAVMYPPGGLLLAAAPAAGGPVLAAAPRGTLVIDASGAVQDAKVKLQISPNIEQGAMSHVNGIIVHQTGGATARSALDSYRKPAPTGRTF